MKGNENSDVHKENPEKEPKQQFPNTSKSFYHKIRTNDREALNAYLESFFSRYWLPLYIQLRADHSHENAEDILQGFISDQLLDKEQLLGWNETGKLRNYLKSCLSNYASNVLRNERAQKRGGDHRKTHLSWEDLQWGGEYYASHIANKQLSPDASFDREWARAVLAEVYFRLHKEYQEAGKIDELNLLLQNLGERGQASRMTYPKIAEQLNIPTASIADRVKKVKMRYEQHLRSVVSESVPPDQVNDEVEFLRQYFSDN